VSTCEISSRRRWRCRAAGEARCRSRSRAQAGFRQQRRHGGHHDGRKAQQAAPGGSPRAAQRPCLRSASTRSRFIMIAFFFTMPMRRMIPISAMNREVSAADHQRQERTHPRGRQGGEDGDRVDVALVQDSEHDVDGDQRGQDQHRLRRQRLLERLRGAEKSGRIPGAGRVSASAAWIALTASPRAVPGSEVEEMVAAGNCPWWLMESGEVPGSKCAKALSGLTPRSAT